MKLLDFEACCYRSAPQAECVVTMHLQAQEKSVKLIDEEGLLSLLSAAPAPSAPAGVGSSGPSAPSKGAKSASVAAPAAPAPALPMQGGLLLLLLGTLRAPGPTRRQLGAQSQFMQFHCCCENNGHGVARASLQYSVYWLRSISGHPLCADRCIF